MRKISNLLLIVFITVTTSCLSTSTLLQDESQKNNIMIKFSNTSSSDIIQLLKNLENIVLEEKTPEKLIVCTYEKLLKDFTEDSDGSTSLSYNSFITHTDHLVGYIQLPVNSALLKDQKALQRVLISLREALDHIITSKQIDQNLISLLGYTIEPITTHIEYRLDSTHIDQQLYEKKAFNSHIMDFDQFFHKDLKALSTIGFALSEIIGRVFKIIKNSRYIYYL